MTPERLKEIRDATTSSVTVDDMGARMWATACEESVAEVERLSAGVEWLRAENRRLEALAAGRVIAGPDGDDPLSEQEKA